MEYDFKGYCLLIVDGSSDVIIMVLCIWVNFGSGNGLLPNGNKPLSDPVLIYHEYNPQEYIFIHFQCYQFCYQSWEYI